MQRFPQDQSGGHPFLPPPMYLRARPFVSPRRAPQTSGGPIDLVGFQNIPMGFEGMELEPLQDMDDDEEEGHVHSEHCSHGIASAKKRKAESDDEPPAAKKHAEAKKKQPEARVPVEAQKKQPVAKPVTPDPAPAEQPPAKKQAPAESEPEKPRPKHEPDFISSKKFTTSKPGYVFKKDTKGVGYYKDVPPKVRVQQGKKNAADEWAEKVVQQQSWRSGPGGMKMRDTVSAPDQNMGLECSRTLPMCTLMRGPCQAGVRVWSRPDSSCRLQVVGKGNTPRRGAKVKVHYTGKLTNGKQFDCSVGRAPFTFTYGAGEVIKVSEAPLSLEGDCARPCARDADDDHYAMHHSQCGLPRMWILLTQ